MDFNLPPDIEALRLRVREFVAEEVMPLEENPDNFNEYDNLKLSVLDEIRAKARSAKASGRRRCRVTRGGLELPGRSDGRQSTKRPRARSSVRWRSIARHPTTAT